MNRSQRRRTGAADARPHPDTPPPPVRPRDASPWLVLGASLLLASLASIPGGPLDLLPATLRFPLVGAAAVGWGLAVARRSGPLRVKAGLLDGLLEGVGLALLLGTFLLIKLPGIHASGTDDNIYFYMAEAMTQGRMPYRDFFFSHPPVHLLIPAAAFGIGGFSIGLAKSIPVLATVAASVFLYLAARRAGRGFALLLMLFHLTTYQVLMASSDMNGENLMTAFLAAGLWALVANRPLLAGAMAGLGLGCGLYALAAVVALGLATGSWRALARFAAGLAITFGGTMAIFAAMAPEAFLDGVFRYHLAKPVKAAGRASVFESANPFRMAATLIDNLVAYLGGKDLAKSLYYHAVQALSLAVVVVAFAGRALRSWLTAAPAKRRQRPEGTRPVWRRLLSPADGAWNTPDAFAGLAIGATVLFLFQWAALNETYDFYQVPMLALMAPLPAWAAWRLYLGVRDATRPAGLILPVLILATLCLRLPIEHSLSRSLWPSEHAAAGNIVQYAWRDPAILPGIARASRALFFSPTRVQGRITPHYRHAIWNKMLTFASAQEIADHIRSNTRPDETITGASTLAPLVALLADRRMAGDEADTNSKRFSSGNWTVPDFRERVCGDNVRYLVGASRSAFTEQFMARTPGFAGTFLPERTFLDPGLLHFREQPIRLYRRIDGPDAPADRVCLAAGETDSRPGR